MRAVVQRVTRAEVRVDGDVVGRIDRPGLCVFLAVTHSDNEHNAAAFARKLHDLRILEGERSIADTDAPVLLVSQFTLYGDTSRGRRPTWTAAAPAAKAEPLIEATAEQLRRRGVQLSTGRFGAHMAVEMVNDGPVTLIIDS